MRRKGWFSQVYEGEKTNDYPSACLKQSDYEQPNNHERFKTRKKRNDKPIINNNNNNNNRNDLIIHMLVSRSRGLKRRCWSLIGWMAVLKTPIGCNSKEVKTRNNKLNITANSWISVVNECMVVWWGYGRLMVDGRVVVWWMEGWWCGGWKDDGAVDGGMTVWWVEGWVHRWKDDGAV